MNFPTIKDLHPRTVPNNMQTLLQVEFEKSSLHNLEHLNLQIGDQIFKENDIQIINQTFAQVKFNGTIGMTNKAFQVMIQIDNSSKEFFYGGKDL